MFKPASKKSFDFNNQYWIKCEEYPIVFNNYKQIIDLVPPFLMGVARPINYCIL